MAVSPDYFQPETAQQANSFLSGLQTGQSLYAQKLQNAYLPQTIQAQLAYLRAQTGTQQAMPGYYGALGNEANSRGQMFGAQAGLVGQQANLLGQQTPYLVQQAQGNVYTDPIIRRAQQAQIAQNSGFISPDKLAATGIGSAQNSVQPGAPGMYQGNTQTSFPAGVNNLQNAAQQLRSGTPANQVTSAAPAAPVTPLMPMTPQQQKTLAALRQNMQQGGQMGNATLPPQFSTPQNPQAQALATPLQNNSIPGPVLGQQVAVNPNSVIPGSVGNPEQNFLLTGSPYGVVGQMQLQAAAKGLQQQATTGVDMWNKANEDAATAGSLGTQMSQLADEFKTNYDASYYKGGLTGGLSTKGIESLPLRALAATQGKDLSAEQRADQAAQTMAALNVKAMMGGGKITNYELQYQQQIKPNRAMDPAAAQTVSDFFKQKAIRAGEQQAFNNAAQAQGLSVPVANTLWQNYNNQRPVYDFLQDKPNPQFQKTWGDFLTPQAISAVQNGQNYISIPSGMTSKQGVAWFNNLDKADQATAREQLRQQKLGGGTNG